jgi:DNA-binding transcriptional ArsR family regulator
MKRAVQSAKTVEQLSALAQETRLAAFRLLVSAGLEGVNAGVIADQLKVSAPTLSFHLKELERAGLIGQRRESRHIIYTADFAAMRALLSYLMQDCCGGRPEICDIELESCCA